MQLKIKKIDRKVTKFKDRTLNVKKLDEKVTRSKRF